MRKIVLGVMAAVLLASAGAWAYGTAAGTKITNANTAGSTPNYRTATNAGSLAGYFTNISGVTSWIQVTGTMATTYVNPGFDLSLVQPALGTLASSAGSTVTFTRPVTNWGNATTGIRLCVTNRGASAGWVGAYYSILTNGSLATGPLAAVDWTYAGLPANNILTLSVRVAIPGALPDGSTNRFQLDVGDGAPLPGDSWPTAGALAPAASDVGNARDWQVLFGRVVVSGPIIRISKSVNLTSARPYDLLTYTISYSNVGSATAYNVTVRDVVPLHSTNAAGFSNAHNGAAWAANGALVGNKVVFTPGGGILNAGDRGLLKFTVQVR